MSDVRAEELFDHLRDQFAEQIRTLSRDIPPHQALQMADALCTVQLSTMAGLRVSYKAGPRVDGDAIAEDWMQGMTIADIVKKHGISRSTAYNYHPAREKRAADLAGSNRAREK